MSFKDRATVALLPAPLSAAGGPGRASPVSSSKEMRPPDQEGGGSDTGTGRGLKIALEGQCQDKSLRETFHD